MPKIQYLHKTRQEIPGIYAQKFGDILQKMNFSRYYRNRGKFIYGFDPNIIIMEYTGDIINIDLYEQEKNLIPKYEIPFPNEALIIFIYVENYSNYTKNGFNDITDVVSIFYPTVN